MPSNNTKNADKNQSAAKTPRSSGSSETTDSDGNQTLASLRPRTVPKPMPNHRDVGKNSAEMDGKKKVVSQKPPQPHSPMKTRKRVSTAAVDAAKRRKTADSKSIKIQAATKKRSTGPQEIPNEFSDGPVEVPHVLAYDFRVEFTRITSKYDSSVYHNQDPKHQKTAQSELIKEIRKLQETLVKHHEDREKLRELGVDVTGCDDAWDTTDAGMEVREKYPGRMELAQYLVTIRFLTKFAAHIEDPAWDGKLHRFVYRELEKTHDDLFEAVGFSRHRVNLLDIAERKAGSSYTYQEVSEKVRKIENSTEFRKLMGSAGSHQKQLERLFRRIPHLQVEQTIKHALLFARSEYFPKGKCYHRLLSNILNNISYNVSDDEWEIKSYTYQVLFEGTSFNIQTDLKKKKSK